MTPAVRHPDRSGSLRVRFPTGHDAICVVRGTRLATRNTSDVAGLGLDPIDPWSSD